MLRLSTPVPLSLSCFGALAKDESERRDVCDMFDEAMCGSCGRAGWAGGSTAGSLFRGGALVVDETALALRTGLVLSRLASVAPWSSP